MANPRLVQTLLAALDPEALAAKDGTLAALRACIDMARAGGLAAHDAMMVEAIRAKVATEGPRDISAYQLGAWLRWARRLAKEGER